MNVPFSVANNWGDFPDLRRAFAWKKEGAAGAICAVAREEGTVWRIRLNDFPDQPCFTLLKEDEAVIHFDDWPAFWTRP